MQTHAASCISSTPSSTRVASVKADVRQNGLLPRVSQLLQVDAGLRLPLGLHGLKVQHAVVVLGLPLSSSGLPLADADSGQQGDHLASCSDRLQHAAAPERLQQDSCGPEPCSISHAAHPASMHGHEDTPAEAQHSNPRRTHRRAANLHHTQHGGRLNGMAALNGHASSPQAAAGADAHASSLHSPSAHVRPLHLHHLQQEQQQHSSQPHSTDAAHASTINGWGPGMLWFEGHLNGFSTHAPATSQHEPLGALQGAATQPHNAAAALMQLACAAAQARGRPDGAHTVLSMYLKQQQQLWHPDLQQPGPDDQATVLTGSWERVAALASHLLSASGLSGSMPRGMSPRQMAGLLWACGSLHTSLAPHLQAPPGPSGARPPHPVLRQLKRSGHALALQLEPRLADCPPQGLANALWALAHMRMRPASDWLSAFMWTTGKLLHAQLQTGGGGSQPKLQSQQQQQWGEGHAPGQTQGQGVMQGHRQEHWERRVGAQGQPMSGFKAQELSSMLWALATLHVPPSCVWWAAFQGVCVQQLQARAFGQQGLANLMWGMAKLQLRPDAKFMDSWCACFKASLRPPTLPSQAQVSQPAAANTAAPAAPAGAQSVPSTLLHDEPQAASAQEHLSSSTSPEPSEAAAAVAAAAAAAARARAQQLHVSSALWALTELGLRPWTSNGWVRQVLELSAPSLPHAAPQSFALTAVALGRLNHVPPMGWQHQLFKSLTPEHMAAMEPKAVLGLLRGLAFANVGLPEAWTTRATQAIAPAVTRGEYDPTQLSMLAHALGMLRITSGTSRSCNSGSSSSAGDDSAVHPQLVHALTKAAVARLFSYARAAASRQLRRTTQHSRVHARGRRRKPGSGGRLLVGASRASVSSRVRLASRWGSRAVQHNKFHAAGPGASGAHATETTHAAGQEGQGRREPRMPILTPRRVARLVWGLWQCGALDSEHAHGSWRAACMAALVHALPHMGLKHLALLLPACTALGVRPPHQSLRPALWLALRGAHANDANELTAVMCAVVRGRWVRCAADKSWVSRCAARVAWGTSLLSPDSLAEAASVAPHVASSHAYGTWAGIMLGMAIVQEVPRKLSALEPEQMAQLAVGLARLPPYSPSTLTVRRHMPFPRYMRVGVLSVPAPHGNQSQGRLASKPSGNGSMPQIGSTLPATASSRSSSSAGDSASATSSSSPKQGLAGVPAGQLTPSSSALLVRPVLPAARAAAALASTPASRGARHPPAAPAKGPASAAEAPLPASPLVLLVDSLFPLLPSLPALQLVGVGSALAAAGAQPGAAWVQSFSNAAVKHMHQPCVSGRDRVGLLKSLRAMGGAPSEAWMAQWYSVTLNRLFGLELGLLAAAVRHACDPARAAGLPPPPAAWIQHAAAAVEKAAKRMSSAQILASASSQSLSTSVSPLAVAQLASTAGRLHALGVATTEGMRQGLETGLKNLSSALESGVLEPHELLHMVHELRHMQPAACGALPHAASVFALRAVIACNPADLFSATWATASQREHSTPRMAQLSHATSATATIPQAARGTAAPALPPGAAAAAQLVSELFAALPRWGVSPLASWLEGALRQCVARVACFSGTQAAGLVRSVALMRPTTASNAAVLELLDGSLPTLPHASTAAVVDLSWALAAMQLQPKRTWWAAYEDEVGSRMAQLPARSLSELLWSLGAVRRRPGRAWMESYMRCVLAQLDAFDPDMVARLVWSLAAVEEAPSRQLMDQVLARSTAQLSAAAAAAAAAAGPSTPAATAGGPASAATAYSATAAAASSGSSSGSSAFSAHTLALLVGGLAAMRVRPRSDWATRFEAQVLRCLPECRGVHLAKILSSFASLDMKPSEALLSAAMARACALAPDLDMASAAEVLWAAERLEKNRAACEARTAAFSAALAAAGLRPPGAPGTSASASPADASSAAVTGPDGVSGSEAVTGPAAREGKGVGEDGEGASRPLAGRVSRGRRRLSLGRSLRPGLAARASRAGPAVAAVEAVDDDREAAERSTRGVAVGQKGR